MMNRREFGVGVMTTLAAPYILKTRLNAQVTRLRRDVTTIGSADPFFVKYAEAVKAMHVLPATDPHNWRNQSLIHLNHCRHGAPDFLHWHRHYLANFELICGQVIGDPGFALPYWNWTEDKGRIPDPFFDLDELDVEDLKDPSNASSANWGPVSTVGTRNLSKGQGLQDDPRRGGAFTKAAIDSIQALSDYNLYWRRLEGSPHNNGHVLTGGANGHMASGMSSLDPIFWLHHCNVDRIWAQWQAAGNAMPALSATYDNQFVDANQQPVAASAANAVKIADFNYTYDVLGGAAVLEEAKKLGLQSFQTQDILSAQDVRRAPQTLGTNTDTKTVTTNVETAYSIPVADLVANLFKSRTFWATESLGVKRLAVGPTRILARLTNVSGPTTPAPILINVFVNCPYLSPETGSDDLHYADSFCFFSPHAAHDSEFIVDVTEPLHRLSGDGRIANNNVKVQLMPITVDPNITTEATFTVGGVEVLRV